MWPYLYTLVCMSYQGLIRLEGFAVARCRLISMICQSKICAPEVTPDVGEHVNIDGHIRVKMGYIV